MQTTAFLSGADLRISLAPVSPSARSPPECKGPGTHRVWASRRRASVVKARRGDKDDDSHYTDSGLGFLVAPDPPQNAGGPPRKTPPRRPPPPNKLVTTQRPGNIVQGPEAVLGIVFVVFAYIKDLVDHFGRLGTGLEHLTDRDMERHLRRALGRVQALEAAQKVEKKAKRELELRLASAHRYADGSPAVLLKAKGDAEATSRSLNDALQETRAELTAAEIAIAEMRGRGITPTNTGGLNGHSTGGSPGGYDPAEFEYSRELADLQEKLEISSQQLTQEISSGERQKRRLEEVEYFIEKAHEELKLSDARNKELQALLDKKTQEAADNLRTSKDADAQTSNEMKALSIEKQELEIVLGDLRSHCKQLEEELSVLGKQSDSTANDRLASALQESELAGAVIDDLSKLAEALCTLAPDTDYEEEPSMVARLQAIQFDAKSVVDDLSTALEVHFGLMESQMAQLKRERVDMSTLLDTRSREVELLHQLETEKGKVLEAALVQLSAEEETNQAFLQRLTDAETRVADLVRTSQQELAEMQRSLDEQIALGESSNEEVRQLQEENRRLQSLVYNGERFPAESPSEKNAFTKVEEREVHTAFHTESFHNGTHTPAESRYQENVVVQEVREREVHGASSTEDYLSNLTKRRP